jgi:hypothetical protein
MPGLVGQTTVEKDYDPNDIPLCVFGVTMFCTMVGAMLGAIGMIGFDAIDYFTPLIPENNIVLIALLVGLFLLVVAVGIGSFVYTRRLTQKRSADNKEEFTPWANTYFNRYLHRLSLMALGFTFVCLPYTIVDLVSGKHLNMFSELQGHYTGGMKFGACMAILMLCGLTLWETGSYQYDDFCEALIRTASGIVVTTSERFDRLDQQ